MEKYFTGQKLGPFIVTKVQPIQELSCTLVQLTHERVGAKVIHIANDDTENLFCLNFDTHPYSSNGVAHILEHTVLCGSKKFPVNDPFFSMNRRSLNTFMNAMTGSDFTCYPAATQIEKDFYNLLEVYLDSVFHPNLNYLSFLQEGHRLEFQDPEDSSSPLVYKGIVYNEMKGTQASPETRLWNEMMRQMLPELTYAVNSGGDPKEIPHLTHDGLLKFHKTFYHPSRCLFFFYGNLPLEKHLKFLEEYTLKDSTHLPELPSIPKQKRFKKPVTHKISYPVCGDDMAKKTYVAFGFLTAPLVNQQEMLALELLDTILMDTDASLLKLPLLKSGLCVHVDSYLDSDMSEVPSAIVFRGCDEENQEKIKTLLFEELEKIAKSGIDQKLIDAALHQLEFHRLEITGNHNPFGLTLFMRAALPVQQGGLPEDMLVIYTQFEKLRSALKDKDYLPSMIRKYFLENTHRVHLTMTPDKELQKQEDLEEKATLEKQAKALTASQKETIIQEALELESFQEKSKHQSLDCLPKLSLSDIPKKPIDIPFKIEKVGDLSIFHTDCFTNHIIYADLLFELPNFTKNDLLYVQLFTSLLTELGTGNRPYTDVLEDIQGTTGGIGAYHIISPQYENRDHLKPAFGIRGKALSRNCDKLFTLMQDFIISPRVDEKKRIKELILQIYHSLQNHVMKSPLSFAVKMSLSSFSHYGTIQEIWGGITFYYFLETLAKNIDTNLEEILSNLQNIKDKIFHQNNPILALSCDKNDYQKIKKNHFYKLSSLEKKPYTPWENLGATVHYGTQARIIPSGVAFTAHGFDTITVSHEDSAALSLSCLLLENKILHQKIREQGGAYGSGASYHPMTGKYYFYAYRDPHLKATLETFSKSLESLATNQITEEELNEAKFGLIQKYDSPIAPGSRAIVAYNLWHSKKTPERRQKYRDQILNLTAPQIQEAVKKHLIEQNKHGVSVAFAGKEMLEKENLPIPTFDI